MCGIAGIISYRDYAPLPKGSQLDNMQQQMQSRGPDAKGIWLSPDKHTGFAHRRLSIIDLSRAANQPFSDLALGYTIIFNGEIYNYHSLRTFLMSKHYRFTTHSDTEVLIKLYHYYGQDMLRHIRGMFSFAIYDHQKHSCFLARDPFGIKPLYYYDDGKQFVFASTLRGLMASKIPSKRLSSAGLTGYFTFGHVPEPFTILQDCMAFPAGFSCYIDTNHTPRFHCYFDYQAEYLNAYENDEPIDNTQDFFGAALKDTLSHHLVSDVPIGIFLSAGKDSSVIAALASELSANPIHTITLGFEDYAKTPLDECPFAKCVADHYQLPWHVSMIDKQDFQIHFDAAIDAMDQPSIDGINTYFVSRAAAELGFKVVLSGLGADELLAGYSDFKRIPAYHKRLALCKWLPGSRSLLARLTRRYLPDHLAKATALFQQPSDIPALYQILRSVFMPWEIGTYLPDTLLKDAWQTLNLHNAMQASCERLPHQTAKIQALQTQWYMRNQLLRDSDWASMAWSLECRVPFVDIELFRSVARLSKHWQVNKNLMLEIPSKPMPNIIKQRKKSGFNIPVASWCHPELTDLAPPLRQKAFARNLLNRYLSSMQISPSAPDSFSSDKASLQTTDPLQAVEGS